MNLSIEVTGIQGVNQTLEAKMNEIRRKVLDAVQGAAIDCQAEAKKACPVDTGRLRSSIQIKAGTSGIDKSGFDIGMTNMMSFERIVGTNVEYGPYVELGTSKMAARPFLFPAFVKASQSMDHELSDIK